jgi:hypothetical protein
LPKAPGMAGMVTFVRYRVGSPLGVLAVSTVHGSALLCSCRRAFFEDALLCVTTDCGGNRLLTCAARLLGTTNRDLTVDVVC